MVNKSDNALTRELIESGSDIAGASVGAAIGLIGGPMASVGGAVAGAALTRTLKHVGGEIKRRLLGPREEVRMGAAFAFAGQLIAANLESNKKLRDDDFFDGDDLNRSAAEQILEGVLLKARDSYEEKKLHLLGILYANIAFNKEVSPAYANQLVNLAGQLTYRQLVALSIAYEQAQKGPLLKVGSFRGDETARNSLGLSGVSLITEIYELYQRGLINDVDGSAWISLTDVNPGGMRAQGTGVILAKMMGLNTIGLKDRHEFYAKFPIA